MKIVVHYSEEFGGVNTYYCVLPSVGADFEVRGVFYTLTGAERFVRQHSL